MLGLAPQYYSHIYIWLVVVLSIVVFNPYATYTQSRLIDRGNTSSTGGVLLFAFLTFFIGLRPISGLYFIDMAGYNYSYETKIGEPFVFNWDTTNKIFDNLLSFFASNNVPVSLFFLVLAAVYFGGIAWSSAMLFPRDKLASFLVYLGAFSTFSYGTNGMKAGVAASLFLIAVALYVNRKYIWAIIFVLLSLGFHHSMILPIVAFVICIFVRDPKLYFVLWIFCLVMAFFHVSFFQSLFASFADDSGVEYLSGSGNYIRTDLMGGFRLDFILYSAAPLVVGWIAVYKKHIVSQAYYFILNLYTLINSVWLLCMYAEFTNRIAYLSWLLFPLVLVYPLLNEDWGTFQYRSFKWIAWGHLGFTLFMQYIIY